MRLPTSQVTFPSNFLISMWLWKADMLTWHNCTWYYCYGYAPRFVQWITTTKMCMLAKVFRTLLVYMVLNKYHWCLWKGILFLIYKCNCVQYLWWLFKGNNVYYAWDSNLAIKNTKTKEPHKKVLKKRKKQQQQFNVKKPKLSLLK